jgi:hypothetical protein
MNGRDANRESAGPTHPKRATIQAMLAGNRRAMSTPRARPALPTDPEATIAYHLKVLEETHLVSAVDGHCELFR